MSNIMKSVFAVLFWAAIVSANIITFDDATGDYNVISNGYGGFDWNNFSVINKNLLPANGTYGTGFENGAVSGNYSAFASDAAIAMTNSKFNFEGAYLTAAFKDGLNIKVLGYKDNVKMYTTTVQVSYKSSTWFDFNYEDIDMLLFTSYGGVAGGISINDNIIYDAFFAMDNFTYNLNIVPKNPPPTNSVPEPGTMSMALVGLMSLAGIAFKRKRRSR